MTRPTIHRWTNARAVFMTLAALAVVLKVLVPAGFMTAPEPRNGLPFVSINCASIPETLIESELFGYEEGAFTGARKKGAVGKILQAHGGTLFLDEIGDMPKHLQARLLRVLQERKVSPLGAGKEVEVDIAVSRVFAAATTADAPAA